MHAIQEKLTSGACGTHRACWTSSVSTGTTIYQKSQHLKLLQVKHEQRFATYRSCNSQQTSFQLLFDVFHVGGSQKNDSFQTQSAKQSCLKEKSIDIISFLFQSCVVALETVVFTFYCVSFLMSFTVNSVWLCCVSLTVFDDQIQPKKLSSINERTKYKVQYEEGKNLTCQRKLEQLHL